MHAVSAKALQSCPTLCDPIDGSLPSSLPGTLQARTLEWVAISFSNAWKWKVKVKSLSCVRLLATPRTAAYQAPLPMGFSWQEYWSGVPLPSPRQSLEAGKKQGNGFSLRSSIRNAVLPNTLILAHWDPFRTSYSQNCKEINLCSFMPPGLR